MCLLISFVYLCIALNIPPLIPFSTVVNKLLPVNNSNFIPVIFKRAWHASQGADIQ